MSALKHSLSFPEVALGSLGQHKMLVYACSMVAMYHNYRLLFCTFMTKFISFPALVTIFNVLWGWNIIPWNSMELSLALAFSLSLSLSLQYVLLQQGLKSHLCTPQFGCKMLLNRTLHLLLTVIRQLWFHIFQEQQNLHSHPFMAVLHCQNNSGSQWCVLSCWETPRYQSNGSCEPVNPMRKQILSRHRRKNVTE